VVNGNRATNSEATTAPKMLFDEEGALDLVRPLAGAFDLSAVAGALRKGLKSGEEACAPTRPQSLSRRKQRGSTFFSSALRGQIWQSLAPRWSAPLTVDSLQVGN
jgi:hypothetical protein